MRVSNVEAVLSGQDILSIINDFVKVDGLNLKEVNIKEEIEIEGNFKKIIKFKFKLNVSIIKIIENNIYLSLNKVKIFKLGIFKKIKNIVLKKVVNNFKEYGISVEKEIIIVNLNKILGTLPFINFNLNNLYIEQENIKVNFSDINFYLNKINEEITSVLEENVQEVIEEENSDLKNEDLVIEAMEVEKVKDNYSGGREFIKEKMPEKIKNYSDYLFLVPDIIALICRLFKDKRVNKKTKTILAASLGYTIMPFDIIPDKIPFIGSIDDLSVIFFALNRIIEDVPMEVILENWQGKNHFVVVLKYMVDYLTRFTGAKNVDKVYNFIDEMVTA
ncbi:Uncharacterized membrane protein YkvA, DUF1232 family [Clostridium cavendishii DSM 21758]|uniref:Uncharacterized membrane protein YkvA, DUF1232 family n=1 Tax=Clostridium cavendishii DSM 21758 TaxID=1121302 RepID=A0A1M6CL43_9CLOT|nr:DUF1232 domain-containing protein [Clostridium cavendishii]SHI61700.1 Uncharacterized membrane protein YkvA, DUF1232 family [Clostridium cavendishii DSM 21758]